MVDKNYMPLVIQLQQAAMDEGVSASSLLLKAKLVASKLGLPHSDMARWIGHELDGYAGAGAELPSCRLLTVEPFCDQPLPWRNSRAGRTRLCWRRSTNFPSPIQWARSRR